MEADWEVEIGPGAPVIDASWQGFVDLRLNPERSLTLPEAADFPALADALITLNSGTSPVWTTKCDIWKLHDPDDMDPSEMECHPDAALHGWACYIDLLPISDQQWSIPEMAVHACKHLCKQLQALPLTCCRADLIVRDTLVACDDFGVGITAYLTACGPTAEQAKQVLQAALLAFSHAIDAISAIE